MERLVLAEDRTRESRELLGRSIDELQIHTRKAVVRYSIPLPRDSPLAVINQQEIKLPRDMLQETNQHKILGIKIEFRATPVPSAKHGLFGIPIGIEHQNRMVDGGLMTGHRNRIR